MSKRVQVLIAEDDYLVGEMIKGLLQDVSELRITLVNASLIARERGLHLVEEKTSDAGHFRNLITLRYSDNGDERVLSGTVMHEIGRAHV